LEAQEDQIISTPQPPADPATLPRLKAGPAFALFVLFFVTQFLTGILVSFTTVIIAALQGANVKDPQFLAKMSQQSMAIATLLGVLHASIVVIYLSRRWFPNEIKERSLTGAAWRVGTLKSILLGLGFGALIALGYLFLSPFMCQPPDDNTIGQFSKMATTPGFQQMIALFIALVIAPPIEELLFRGVMFGGICRSFGPVWSAIITTSLFVAVHVMEAIHFWPAFVFIGLMASAALWFRLHTKTIGPSIALHFAYNLFIFGPILLIS
jgi:membrane protease YdiL (CAAX protease family)